MKYFIEHQIFSLTHNAVKDISGEYSRFSIEDIVFSDRDFNYRDGWQGHHWIVSRSLDEQNATDAINSFSKTLSVIVPKISLIGQSFIEYAREPWLIKKENTDIALFRLTRDRAVSGLMFMEPELKALDILLKNDEVSKEFYYYWNDATNTFGYPAKLLIMFSAIEALCKSSTGQKDWQKVRDLLGSELASDIFGTPEESNSSLRNRLVHGEYFAPSHEGKNYVELIHKKVLEYFNREIFKAELLNLTVVNPQRHPFGFKEGGYMWLKMKHPSVSLKQLLQEFKDGEPQETDSYVMVFDQDAVMF